MEFMDEQERLVAEQAVLRYRAVNEAADQAAFGHGMEAMEDAVLQGSREMSRQWLEAAMKRRAAEKDRANVRGAAGGPISSGSRRGR